MKESFSGQLLKTQYLFHVIILTVSIQQNRMYDICRCSLLAVHSFYAEATAGTS